MHVADVGRRDSLSQQPVELLQTSPRNTASAGLLAVEARIEEDRLRSAGREPGRGFRSCRTSADHSDSHVPAVIRVPSLLPTRFPTRARPSAHYSTPSTAVKDRGRSVAAHCPSANIEGNVAVIVARTMQVVALAYLPIGLYRGLTGNDLRGEMMFLATGGLLFLCGRWIERREARR